MDNLKPRGWNGWKQGQSGNPRGRPRNAKIRANFSASIKQSIIKAYSALGGEKAFIRWCKENKDFFYKEGWVKLLPKDVVLEHQGEIENKFTIELVKFNNPVAADIATSGEIINIEDQTASERVEAKALPGPVMELS